jgi:hypothetical protein
MSKNIDQCRNKAKTLYKGIHIINIGENMVNMTFSLPDDIHKKMKKYPEIKWSAVARSAIIGYLQKLERMDQLLEDSELTKEDVMELDRIIKKSAMKTIKKRKKIK